MRGANRSLVAEHWPGPDQSLRVILRLAASTTASDQDPTPGSLVAPAATRSATALTNRLSSVSPLISRRK